MPSRAPARRGAPGRDLIAGAGAGAVAAVAMSALMLAGQRLGVLPGQPPERLVEAVLKAASIKRSERSENALASVAHVAFGAACGAAFRWGHRRLGPPGPAWLHGVLYGVGVWFVSYSGWIPALGVLPPPRRDVPGRAVMMVLAHVVYGATLGALTGRARVADRGSRGRSAEQTLEVDRGAGAAERPHDAVAVARD